MTLPPRDSSEEQCMSEWRIIAEWDWVILGKGEFLHAVAAIYNDHAVDTLWVADGTTACGRDGSLTIPGLGDRFDAARCAYCCSRTGMPEGFGSPKNDDDLRWLVERRLAALGQKERNPDEG